MSDARAAILDAIRRHPLPASQVRDIGAAASALSADPEQVRPKLDRPDIVEAFTAKLPFVGNSIGNADCLDDFPAAVCRYLGQNDLPAAIYLQPDPSLKSLDWSGLRLNSVLARDEQVGVGLARAAVAETGSLVFASGADTAVLGHFLPIHHVVGVRKSDIVGYLEDICGLAENMPRNLNLVTGPSGTTDIEGEFVLGAHGPRFLHVVLIGEAVR